MYSINIYELQHIVGEEGRRKDNKKVEDIKSPHDNTNDEMKWEKKVSSSVKTFKQIYFKTHNTKNIFNGLVKYIKLQNDDISNTEKKYI